MYILTSWSQEERAELNAAQRGGPGRHASSVDYTRNSHIKPPYSYATLICMAIRYLRVVETTVIRVHIGMSVG